MAKNDDGYSFAEFLVLGAVTFIALKTLLEEPGAIRRAEKESADQRTREREAERWAEQRREEAERRAERRSELEQMADDGTDVCLGCLTSEPDRAGCGHCIRCNGDCNICDDD